MPENPRSRQVAVRIPSSLDAALDAYRLKHDITFSRAMVTVLEEALSSSEPDAAERLATVEGQLATLRQEMAQQVGSLESDVDLLKTQVASLNANYQRHYGVLAIVFTANGGSYDCLLRVSQNGTTVESSHEAMFQSAQDDPGNNPKVVWLINPAESRREKLRELLAQQGIEVFATELHVSNRRDSVMSMPNSMINRSTTEAIQRAEAARKKRTDDAIKKAFDA